MLLSEQLVGEARARRASKLAARERHVSSIASVLFLLVATATAVLLPYEREVEPVLVVGLVIGFAIVYRVRFEFGGGYTTPENLALVPLVLLGPLPAVPLLIVCAIALSLLPEVIAGRMHRDSLLWAPGDAWSEATPAVVLMLLAPGALDTDHLGTYLLAWVALVAVDLLWTLLRNQLLDRVPVKALLVDFAGSARIEAILVPIAFVVSVASADQPLYLLSVLPLVALFQRFSADRHERYTKALELQRAYRGTVMLLSDVVESEDGYTAEHSRSVVELADAVADELGIPSHEREELEFAAMLHDVGKISMPKEILFKPARLTDGEFEVMKTHTIEGQFLLDRVGGLLGRVGDIVRSCHERWDGSGYPDGLAGEAIPFAARIVFCCDAYNAMTTDRVYRSAMSQDAALNELRANAGSQFDPVVVEALIRVIQQQKVGISPSGEVRALLAGARSMSGPSIAS